MDLSQLALVRPRFLADTGLSEWSPVAEHEG